MNVKKENNARKAKRRCKKLAREKMDTTTRVERDTWRFSLFFQHYLYHLFPPHTSFLHSSTSTAFFFLSPALPLARRVDGANRSVIFSKKKREKERESENERTREQERKRERESEIVHPLSGRARDSLTHPFFALRNREECPLILNLPFPLPPLSPVLSLLYSFFTSESVFMCDIVET